MPYRVKEIFYTLQGEGANAGRPAIFCRFAGCNLWSGREEDRDKGPGSCSRWCDTDFVGGTKYDDAEDLVDAILGLWPRRTREHPFVVLTGGEPMLQVNEELLNAFKVQNVRLAIETNGLKRVPKCIDWVCVSPKAGQNIIQFAGDELKLIYPQRGIHPMELIGNTFFRHYYLQPMDGPNLEANTQAAIQYCLKHPEWRLSLQTHKLIGLR